MLKNPFQHFINRFMNSEPCNIVQQQQAGSNCVQTQTLEVNNNPKPFVYIYGRDQNGSIKQLKKDIVAYKGDYGYCVIDTCLEIGDKQILNKSGNIQKIVKKNRKGKNQVFQIEQVLITEIGSGKDCYVDFATSYIATGFAKIHKDDFGQAFYVDDLEIVTNIF